jgi:small subunit ribosomal protein S15e
LTDSPPNKSSSSSEPDKEEDSPEVHINHNNIEIKHRYNRFYNKCKKSKKNCQPGEKPSVVKTHLRNCIVMPEMVGNIVGVYSGKVFNPVEIKFDMIGRYLGEFSLSYKPTRHGKAGVGATKGSAHTSLK